MKPQTLIDQRPRSKSNDDHTIDRHYPLGKGWAPDAGNVVSVGEGVYWLHMVLPEPLTRINLWLIKEDLGWILVDTGMNTRHCRSMWQQIEAEHLGGLPLVGIITTHMHPDHMGLAGWLCQRHNCELWSTRGEYLMSRHLFSNSQAGGSEDEFEFYRATGMNRAQVDDYRQQVSMLPAILSPLPDAYHRLTDGQQLTLGNAQWQVIITSGHSPEHASLYCPDKQLLISGDQVLPGITPNIGVYPIEPYANPVSEWVSSCEKMKQQVSDEALVLPAHGEPFFGLHTRLDELREAATENLDALVDFLSDPRSIVDCFPILFNSEITDHNRVFAVAETRAYMNYLITQRRVARPVRHNHVDYFSRI